uniref:Uncharacterized protein n=1 Tax=Glossina pallidipes TaxID=7398 RepID=A0A1B0AH16_GLOPL
MSFIQNQFCISTKEVHSDCNNQKCSSLLNKRFRFLCCRKRQLMELNMAYDKQNLINPIIKCAHLRDSSIEQYCENDAPQQQMCTYTLLRYATLCYAVLGIAMLTTTWLH